MEKKDKINRIMIAGTKSGCGKTTVSCALLKGLSMKGKKVSAFKCGPDFIDPMFHEKILKVPSCNLDLFLCGEEETKSLFYQNAKNCEIAVVEGVMGFYDGMAQTGSFSSYDLSEKTGTPVILVIDCAGMSLSVNAELFGFLRYKKNRIKGIILNNVSAPMAKVYEDMVKKDFDVLVLGFLPKIPQAKIESRHLGLVTAGEIFDIEKKMTLLGKAAIENIDLEALELIAQGAPLLSYTQRETKAVSPVNIAVAKDQAFCFYYADSLNLLKNMGANLLYFSPLDDQELPKEADGLYLWGGYPELYLPALSKNKTMLKDIKNKIAKKMPVIAECGGFMYLFEKILDQQGNAYEMAGVLKGKVRPQKSLIRFGYTTLTANRDNILCLAGQSINAHEFHYFDSDNNGTDFTAQKPLREKNWKAIHANEHMFCGFPHIHFCGNPEFAKNFILACAAWKGKSM